MTRLVLWPFFLVWYVVAGIFLLVWRFIAILTGMILALVGGILTVTIIGAIVGLPLMATGGRLIRLGLS
jgi:hypothetical protein